FFFFFFFFFETESCPVAQAGVQRAGSQLTASSASRLKKSSHVSLPSSWDHRHTPPYPANFVFFVETGFHHVAQAGLELL
ncbi:hypothetical protein H8957_017648, partial [Semnopithecus entellus]